MPLLRPLALLLPLAFLPCASTARAAMATFSFAGADDDNPDITATGTLTFAFADGKTTLGLGDVTAFRFAYTLIGTDPSLPLDDSFTFGLSDLTSFAATVASGGRVTALSLRTGFEPSANGTLADQFVVVSSLRPGGVETYLGTGPHDDALGGTLTPAVNAVPEPGSLALLGIASGLGVLANRFRRRGRSPRHLPAPAATLLGCGEGH